MRARKILQLGTWFYATLWLVGVLAIIKFLPVKEWSLALSELAQNMGPEGAVIFSLVFVTATICLIPCAFLTFSAGVAYGLWAIPLVMFSAVAGASLSFFIARYFMRERVRRWLSHHTNTEALKETIEDGGWKTMLLLRLSPMIPFNVNNYFLGTVKVDYVPYILVMVAGTLPLTSLLVYLGSLGKDLDRIHPLQLIVLIAGVLATAVFLRRVLQTRAELLKHN